MNETQAKDATGYTNVPIPSMLAIRAHQNYRPIGVVGSMVSTRGARLPLWSGTPAAPKMVADVTVQTVVEANKRAIAIGNDPTYDVAVPNRNNTIVHKVDPGITPRVGLSAKKYRDSTFDPRHNWTDTRVKGQY